MSFLEGETADMRKNVYFYIAAFALLLLVLFLYNSAYKQLRNYADLSDRHQSVMTLFQQLSKELNNAAILNPDLDKAMGGLKNGDLFFTDSTTINFKLEQLKATVKDSINIKIAASLDTLVKSEIGWLIKSNIPDSLIQQQSAEHIHSFRQINSLIEKGIQRTNYLIDYRRNLLHQEIRKVSNWMSAFTILSAIMLMYTLQRLFLQKKRTKEKELELETAFNRVNDGVVSLNTKWEYTFLNDAALVTHPLGKDKTIGKLLWEIHPQIKETIFWEKYSEAMETKKSVEIENYFPPLDTWFSVKAYPSDNGLTIFFKDITALKKSETQDLLFSSIVNSTEDAILSKDLSGIITSWNKGAEKIFGYRAEEIIGNHISMIIPRELQHEETQIIKTIREGKAVEHYETQRIKKDGTLFHVSLTVSPLKDSFGNVIGASKIIRDITARKIAEEKIIKSEKVYKTIASSIPGSVICLLDTDYRYLLIEGDMLEKLGYSREKLLGNKAGDVLPPEIFKPVREGFEKVLKGGTVTRETNYGSYDVISRYIPLRDENNNVYSIMTVAIDVTELKKAEHHILELNADLEKKIQLRTEQLKKSNEELEAFSYSVSHDLRSPLRSIIGFSAILEEEYGNKLDDEAKRLTGIIKDNTLKMARLIDDLLAFSKTGKQQLSKTTIDIMDMVNDVRQNLLQHQESYSRIHWNIHVLLPVEGDLNTIRQVWVNLLSNAAKYSSTREQPVIEVGSRKENNEIVFFVKDNGVGFDEEYKDKLFKVFQRLHDADEFEGTGVGLALVDKIISKHGGKVWAEGKENKGAIFYFSLPA